MNRYTNFHTLTRARQQQLISTAATPEAPHLLVEPMRIEGQTMLHPDASASPVTVSAVHVQLGAEHRVFTMKEVQMLIDLLQKAQRDLAISLVPR